jgi:hypothetical protein
MSRFLRTFAAVIAGLATLGLTANSAAAARPPVVQAPAPLPVSPYYCYLQCASPALLHSATPQLPVRALGTAGYQLSVTYEVRTRPQALAHLVVSGESAVAAPGSEVSWQVPAGKLLENVRYFWRARSTNEKGTRGPWSGWQEVKVDLTPPGAPSVVSAEYPEGEWGPVLGTPGTFHFQSSGNVAVFQWGFNGESTEVAATNGSASVVIVPPGYLTQILAVKAVDVAGNVSSTTYSFKVTPPPDLYSHWALDESGVDSGNLGINVSLTGGVAFGPGYVGGSPGAVFTAGDGLISTPAQVLDTARSFTVMGWVNPASLSQPFPLWGQNGAQLSFDPVANAGAGGWCFTLGATVTCSDGAVLGAPVQGTWTHLAMRFDAIAGKAEVLVAGGMYACGGEQVSVPASGVASAGAFLIGGQFTGSVDDVIASQRAMSDSEICQHALQ